MEGEAPLHHGIADGPPGGRAFWLRADDGLRLRAAHWPGGDRGTVFLIPGRTECIEKYGRAAGDLVARGFHVLAIDNRGQGLADRLTPDPMLGHVGRFADYQRDLRAALPLVQALGLPAPLHLLGHSMGGAIGLRALIEAFPVRSAVFSAPMWGIAMAPMLAPVVRVMGAAARATRLGARYAPSTRPVPYPLAAPFEDNTLTTDRAMWDWMGGQLRAHPELGLGGPSLHWLDCALAECNWLARQPLPAIPALVIVGTGERIVEVRRLRALIDRWPTARLDMAEGAQHEVMMETPAIRARFFDAAAAHFAAVPNKP
ncbi:MAG: alpha/beta hydrolase [Paracoccaceae bacterium]|nr:MAG: alpha/beta hydrolase [Paracoccaceae bacterium]